MFEFNMHVFISLMKTYTVIKTQLESLKQAYSLLSISLLQIKKRF
jgi:hypothetical protein